MLPGVADAGGPWAALNRRAFTTAGGADGRRRVKVLGFSCTVESLGLHPEQWPANRWGRAWISVSCKAPEVVKTQVRLSGRVSAPVSADYPSMVTPLPSLYIKFSSF